MKILLSIIISVFCIISLYAQRTTIQLPTADSSSSFRVLKNTGSLLMRLNADNGFYLGGIEGTGNIPTTGPGTRLMWHPAKAALRVGTINGTHWDDASIGSNSVAMGYNITASGFYSMATGYETIASGSTSTAMGGNTTASGGSSTAMGTNTIASGSVSTAMGGYTTAGGSASTAMGWTTTASGDYSTAMGYSTTASGIYSTAMGRSTVASGNYSTAIGYSDTASGARSIALGSYVSTNGQTGCCVIGDGSSNASLTRSSTQNEMTMRFDGGYRLYTNYTLFSGVTLPGGSNSWGTVSDSTKKMNYTKADGEYFLSSLSQLRLGSWNYKGQNAKTFRHYGPMAQEIFYYFGKDVHGTIGNDTTLSTADMDGIMMICLQALEKRTAELQKANEKISKLEERMEKLEQIIALTTVKNTEQMTSNK